MIKRLGWRGATYESRTAVPNAFDLNAGRLTQNVPNGPNPCAVTENANFDQFVGDGSIGMIYSMTVPAGRSQTVKMT